MTEADDYTFTSAAAEKGEFLCGFVPFSDGRTLVLHPDGTNEIVDGSPVVHIDEDGAGELVIVP